MGRGMGVGKKVEVRRGTETQRLEKWHGVDKEGEWPKGGQGAAVPPGWHATHRSKIRC